MVKECYIKGFKVVVQRQDGTTEEQEKKDAGLANNAIKIMASMPIHKGSVENDRNLR